MSYKTFSKEEIKVIGYDLLTRALHVGGADNDQYMHGIVKTVEIILSKFEEDAKGEQ